MANFLPTHLHKGTEAGFPEVVKEARGFGGLMPES